MSRVLTATEVIESVKRRAMIPEDQVTFSQQDFLDIINEEMNISVVPKVLQVHEEYYLYEERVTLESNKRKYRIPYRSIGNKLRDLQYNDLNGNVFEITRVSIEDISDYQGNFTTNRFNTAFVRNHDIEFLTSVEDLTGEVVFSFYLRPNDLVLENRTATITAIDTGTGVITVSSLPTALQTLSPMDFIDNRSPNNIIDYDITPTTFDNAANTITFTASELPSDLKVGDYINLANETQVLQIPTELIPLVAQRAAVHCLESLGDTESLANATKKLQTMEKSLYNLIDNRIEGAPQKIINRHGPLRSTLTRGFNRRQ